MHDSQSSQRGVAAEFKRVQRPKGTKFKEFEIFKKFKMSVARDFEELAIFQKARELSKKIYPITQRDEFKSDLLVFGTRPEAIKMCPLVTEFQKHPQEFETMTSYILLLPS